MKLRGGCAGSAESWDGVWKISIMKIHCLHIWNFLIIKILLK